MRQKVTLPDVAPAHHETGFYYHYKHDPAKGVFDYAYFILGLGVHTEDEIDPDDQFMQVYLPLYPSAVYKLGKFFDLRPGAMAYESVTKDGVTMPRFRKITDPEVIAQCKAKLKEMYPELTSFFQ